MQLPGYAFFIFGEAMLKKTHGYWKTKRRMDLADGSEHDHSNRLRAQALSSFKSGQKAIIVDHARGRRAWAKMESMGLMPGVEVSVLLNSGLGPLLVAVENSRFMLGRGMAEGILSISANSAKKKAEPSHIRRTS